MANWIFIRAWSNLLSGKGRFFSKLPVVRAELFALALGIVRIHNASSGWGSQIHGAARAGSSGDFWTLAFLGLLIISRGLTFAGKLI